MSVTAIATQDQFSELTTVKDKLVSLYFHTSWAQPCIAMNEVYKHLAEQHQEVSFLSIDADEQAEISELFEVSAVPYFILVKNGEIIKEISGSDPKEFATALEAAAGKSAAPKAPTAPLAAPVEEEETEDQLNERLRQLTNAAPVMVFIKGTPSEPKCGFSRQLVGILRENQVRFGFFDILKDDSVRQGLKAFSEWPTFPQLYIKGEFQGGLDIVKESLEDDPEFFAHALE